MSLATLPHSLDVILVRGSSFKSTGLCVLQSIAMRRVISFSHVALTLGEGISLHATVKGGVHLIRSSELWTSARYRPGLVVLRSRRLNADIEADDLLRNAVELRQAHDFARKSFGARYNPFFGLPKRWLGMTSWFCSELAADALKQAGCGVVSGRSPEQTWPGHFQRCRLHADEWEDVTKIHSTYAAAVTKGSDSQCTDTFARTRYLTGEVTFQTYERVLSQLLDGDEVLKDARALDAKIRSATAEIIRATKEIQQRMGQR
jgi:hypothetical protein